MKKLVFLIVFSVPFAGAQVQVQGTAIQIGSGAIGPAGPPGSGNVNQVTASAISFVGTNGSRQIVAAPYMPVNKAGDTMTGPLGSNYGNVDWSLSASPAAPGRPSTETTFRTDVDAGGEIFLQYNISQYTDVLHNQFRWSRHPLLGYYCGFPQVPGSNFFSGTGVYLEFGGFQLGQPNNCPFYISDLAPNKSLFVLDDGSTLVNSIHYGLPCPTTSTSTGTAGESRDSIVSGVAYHCYALATNTWVRVAMSTW